MKVKVLSPLVAFGEVGKAVEVPDGIDADALIAAGLVELAKSGKPAEKADGGDD
jgi:hypothetical protein